MLARLHELVGSHCPTPAHRQDALSHKTCNHKDACFAMAIVQGHPKTYTSESIPVHHGQVCLAAHRVSFYLCALL